MLEVRKSADRGRAHHGWLKSSHSFSFADYFDTRHSGFGPLLVINEDEVAPGRGFGTHGHRDMEITSHMLDGTLAHEDSMGNGSALRYGDVQRMSAGTGVRHSEFNHSSDEPVHFLQIWIEPKFKGIAPSYEEKHFDVASKTGQLRLIVSPDGRNGSVTVNRDACLYVSILGGTDAIEYLLKPGRIAYVHAVRGSACVNGVQLATGDALKLVSEDLVTIRDAVAAEVLLFDLPA